MQSNASVESIDDLLLQANDDDFEIWKQGFEGLKFFVGSNAISLPNFSVFEKLISTHFDHLNDKN